ncbi:MAG: hypothetical protein AAGE52_03720 [Myxococcota bacterium]
MRHLFVYGFSALMIGLVISPALRDPPVDSFPLSDYPMFSHGRPNPDMEITHALGVRADGTRVPLPPLVSAGNREVLQSMMTIANETFSPRKRDFCAEVAERVAESGDFEDVEGVELATSIYDAVHYFEVSPEPAQRRVHYRCAVTR